MFRLISAAALGAVLFVAAAAPVRAFRGDYPVGPPAPPAPPECRLRCDPAPPPPPPPPSNDGPCRGGRAC